MGWRFRKSFSPLPGVRLTLSPRGLSTSLGAGPLRFTVGPQGSAITARIPGTGIAFRQPVTPRSPARQGSEPARTPSPPTIPDEPPQEISTGQGEIRSAGTSEITSPGLSKFRELLAQAQQERRNLLPELQQAIQDASRLKQKRAAWQRGWFLRRLFAGQYARIQEKAEEAKARREELEEQERLSRLQTQIDLPDQVRRVYSQLVDAFAVLAKCERKWDTLARVATDRVRERTTAFHSIDRRPVAFDLGSCDLIESEWRVPHLQNANGGDLYIYPGFVLLHISAEAFALVDITEVDIEAAIAAFIEEETVPTDTRVVRQAWKKANKDGSPDRRFANNYQIPVVEYGRLAFRSPSGLNEEYMLSNYPAVAQFDAVWKQLKCAVAESTA